MPMKPGKSHLWVAFFMRGNASRPGESGSAHESVADHDAWEPTPRPFSCVSERGFNEVTESMTFVPPAPPTTSIVLRVVRVS